jgi:DNA repair protein RecN (Recombination protein N)
MLASLTVRDIVLIERAALEFAPGLNVLTGETGAGKSILLDALGLAAGNRGQGRGAVRPGAEQGNAVAVFDLPRVHPAWSLLKDNDLDGADDLILRRTVAVDGRTRAFVNDAPVGVALAREVGAILVEIHGQQDDRGLFDTATHRILLDVFAGHGALAQDVGRHYALFAAARDHVAALKRGQDEALREIDYLRHVSDELESLAPEAGEEHTLAEELSAAAEFVSGENGAEATLASALRRLARMNEEGRRAAEAAERALDGAFAQLQEGRQELDALMAKLDAQPGKLEQVEERLFALRAASRKYNVPCDGLADFAAQIAAKLALLDAGGGGIAAAEKHLTDTRAAFLDHAKKLSASRRAAATRLEAAVANELSPLKLGHAKFRVGFTALAEEEANAFGFERISFEVATVEGAVFGPIGRIASGGELARFALALKVALAEQNPPAVLVFDEVDRGVGGAVADAVGERLQRLAKTTQVLLVTHSPQVAARAAQHFRISRKGDVTRVDALTPEERLEEIARMLSGAAVTDEARAAAKRLVSEAQTQTGKKRVRA